MSEHKNIVQKTGEFFKKAFEDMAESARTQHEVDKANLDAVRAESRAQWEEAKLSPREQTARLQAERAQQLTDAQERIRAAQSRIDAARSRK